jgi:hypothetical protein
VLQGCFLSGRLSNNKCVKTCVLKQEHSLVPARQLQDVRFITRVYLGQIARCVIDIYLYGGASRAEPNREDTEMGMQSQGSSTQSLPPIAWDVCTYLRDYSAMHGLEPSAVTL